MKRIVLAALGLLAFLPAHAQAYDWVATGKVIFIEGTYIPSQVPFHLDVAGGSTCPSGYPLVWNAHGSDAALQASNAQGVLAMLMTAEASGRTVTAIGNNINGGVCSIDYLYLN